ncbi:MAG: helix-turn-helix transcriptional regulator [Thermodesulfobacteriota bacterium]
MAEQKGMKSGVAMVQVSGETIRSLRQQQNLTQLYLATAVEVTTETISRWERSESPTIKKENGEKLAEALGVALDAILFEEQPLPPDPPEEPEQPEVAPPPSGKRWIFPAAAVLGILLFAVSIFWRGGGGVQISATRTMPAHAVAGQPFPVVIDVKIDSGKGASFLVTEQLPSACRVLQAVPETAVTSETFLKWIEKSEATETSFAYLLSCDAEEEVGASIAFSGVVLARRATKKEIPVNGRSHLRLSDFHWVDTNQDNVIDDEELLGVYDDFGRVAGLGVDVDEVEEIWMGSGYRWNGEKKMFEPVP